MPGVLGVWLGDRRIGELANIPGDYNVFSFDEGYVEDPSAPVLSQSFLDKNGLPIRIIPRTQTVAAPFFANLLPENPSALRELLAKEHSLKVAPDFPLLRVLGRDLPGAVVLVDESETADDSVSYGSSATTIQSEPQGVHQDEPLRFSLAGVQLKFSASLAGQRLTIPLEGQGGSWIAKLPSNAFPRLTENEFAMMSFARAVGLNVPEIRLVDIGEVRGLPSEMPALREDEHYVYAIARYDRLADGSRVHAEDFNQIAGQFPRDKYENRSTSWIAGVVSTLCPPEDIDELIARVVFGVAIGNGDMHLKNWSLLYSNGRDARLAPVYDYVCTLPYLPAGELALTVGGERRFSSITTETIVEFAKRAEISKREAVRVARATVERIRASWASVRESVPDHRVVAAVEQNMTRVPLLQGR